MVQQTTASRCGKYNLVQAHCCVGVNESHHLPPWWRNSKAAKTRSEFISQISKPPTGEPDWETAQAIRSLRRDKDIIIRPGDKGNATVAMNRSDCTVKMESQLEDPAYKKLKRNPTTRVETRISSALKELGQKGYLSNKQRLSLSPSFSTAPQIYNLPKIHKEGTLLRPIASAIRSPTHQARQLVRILNPLQGTTHCPNLSSWIWHHGELWRGKPLHKSTSRWSTSGHQQASLTGRDTHG